MIRFCSADDNKPRLQKQQRKLPKSALVLLQTGGSRLRYKDRHAPLYSFRTQCLQRHRPPLLAYSNVTVISLFCAKNATLLCELCRNRREHRNRQGNHNQTESARPRTTW
jgi:hypothetical protein